MASLNKVLLMGNLTKDPEVRYTPSGSAVCDFSLAINRRYSVSGQEKEEVCFVDIIVWSKQAESCGKYLHKGSPAFVEGRLKTDTWEDKDGKKRSRMRVTAERVQFLSSPKTDDSRSNYYNSNQHNNEPASAAPQNNHYSNGYNDNNANRQASYYGNETDYKPMPQPPHQIFDNEIESEDDIPF